MTQPAASEDYSTYNPFTAEPPQTDYLARNAFRGSQSSVGYYISNLPETLNTLSAGRPPVLWAISRARENVLQQFISAKADLTVKTIHGDNALTCAIWSGEPDMVNKILSMNLFDPDEKNFFGKSPVDWAEESGIGDIIEPVRAAAAAYQEARLARQQQKREVTLAEHFARADELQQKLNAGARKSRLKIKPSHGP